MVVAGQRTWQPNYVIPPLAPRLLRYLLLTGKPERALAPFPPLWAGLSIPWISRARVLVHNSGTMHNEDDLRGCLSLIVSSPLCSSNSVPGVPDQAPPKGINFISYRAQSCLASPCRRRVAWTAFGHRHKFRLPTCQTCFWGTHRQRSLKRRHPIRLCSRTPYIAWGRGRDGN